MTQPAASTHIEQPADRAPAVSAPAPDPQVTGRTSGALPFVLGSMLLGTIGVFAHEARADPLTITWFRCVFGLIGLTVWVLMRGQAQHLRLTRTNAAAALTVSSLLIAAWALFFLAIERTSTGVAVVLFHMQPMWVLALGAWWLKEPIGVQRFASVGVAMIGLVLATGILEHTSVLGGGGGFRPGYWVGIAACLIGAVLTAIVTITAKGLREMPAGVLAWWQCAVGTALLWLWPMQHGWPAWGPSWGWLAGLGLIHTGLAYSLLYAGMPRLSTARIAVLQFVYPAVSIVIDWLYFDQRLGPMQLTGVVLMAVAIWLAERGRG